MNDYKFNHGTHHRLGDNDGYVYCARRSWCYTASFHTHTCFEFVYFTEGTCVYTVEGKEFIIAPGDIIFTCPNELHSFSFPKECSFERQFIHVYPDLVHKFEDIAKKLIHFSSMHKNHIPGYLAEKHGLPSHFNDLRKYHPDFAPETEMLAYSSIFALMAKICYLLRTANIDKRPDFSNSHINNIIRCIDVNYTHPISLDAIADELHISTVYLSKLFKKETGMTIKSYINMRRIVDAKNHIFAGDKITTLPQKCGFDNYPTFYRAFVKYTGVSPDEFRQRAVSDTGTV